MSDRKWEVGKKYRLVNVAGFIASGYPNKDIADKLGTKEFTVESLRNRDTGVKTLVEISLEGLDWSHWFNGYEIQYFEEVTTTKVEDTSAIIEWLDKLAYVIETDTTVGSRLEINLRNQAVLPTIHGVIVGSQNVLEFINNRYSQLTEQTNKAKREQLLKDVVSAKEAYEAKVRELELLEGK